MSAQDHFRRLAEHWRMAAHCSDPEIASALRILAADYFSSANQPPVGQQQQQIQPKESEGDEK